MHQIAEAPANAQSAVCLTLLMKDTSCNGRSVLILVNLWANDAANLTVLASAGLDTAAKLMFAVMRFVFLF